MSRSSTTPQTSRAPEAGAAAEHSLGERVGYALLLPLVRLARVRGTPLAGLTDLTEMAYFHELRRAGLKLREIAEQMGTSMRKAALLSQRLKVNFLQPEVAVGLPRRIEFMLWAEPLSRAQITRALPAEVEADIDAALEQLLSDGRLRRVTSGRREILERVRANSRIVADGVEARLDALQNLVGNVVNAVYARFFAGEERAFARTITFQVRRRDLGRLAEAYEQLWRTVVDLEKEARTADDAFSMDLSLLWAPFEYLAPGTTPERQGDEHATPESD